MTALRYAVSCSIENFSIAGRPISIAEAHCDEPNALAYALSTPPSWTKAKERLREPLKNPGSPH
jgi:hypothetical protein